MAKRGDLLGDVDRLATYRSKRDAAKTPEPVPARRAKAGNGRSLRHPGAPRLTAALGLPPGTRRRAGELGAAEGGAHRLQARTTSRCRPKTTRSSTAAFEGDIPKGEYGGGHVDIWDEGTYELEKWRDGKEVIATLHGTKQGVRKYALIRTGGEGKDAQNWLIHLMKDQP